MNKQEVIEKIKTLKPYEPDLYEYDSKELKRFEEGFLDAKIYAELAVKELDEPEKPVVPQYVDTWVQGCKYNGFDLYEAMTSIEMPMEFDNWLETNSETFAKAWLFGYEIEKEKLYTVEIPSPNRVTEPIIYLSRGEEGKLFLNSWVVYASQNWKNQPHAQLTESEIKEDFGWAWPFAEEVKDE